MNFTYDPSGTSRQIAWAQEAIGKCGYDLSLLATDVLLKWVEPVPVSPDIGHLHSYMVTESNVDAGYDYTIFIEKSADDPLNRNNKGLPDPVNDIQDFYEASIVHELGHIVCWQTIFAQGSQAFVASLFWTPDTSGGSGRRYGTLADWSVGVWAQNMNEAVAETFKCVYYPGNTIYLNRTIWHLDPTDWPSLWFKLLPPEKTLWKNSGMQAQLTQSGRADIGSPDTLPLSYLDAAHAQLIYGPVLQNTPYPIPNPGGDYILALSVDAVDLSTGESLPVADITMNGAMNMSPSVGLPFSFATGTLSVGTTPVVADASFGNPGAGEPLDIFLNSEEPGVISVRCLVFGGLPEADGVANIPATHSHLRLTGHAIVGGEDFSINVDRVSWLSSYSASPPPFPFGNSSGQMAAGSGLRGAILIGSN